MISRITTCPHCSTRLRLAERITDKSLICPHCLAEVDNAWPGSQIRADDIDTDVKRDVNVGSIVLAVLMGLCVLGISITSSFGPLIFLGAIAGLVIIAFIRSIFRAGASSAPASIVEKAIRILFLVFGTIVAIVIFVIYACAMAFRGPYH
ncbi:MAG: hypothetical protein ACRELG_29900 [Gemmataceae bacterium]